MNLPLFTPVGLVAFIVMLAFLAHCGRRFRLGIISLPAVSVLTSILYFFVIPGLSMVGGYSDFFGLRLQDLDAAHFLSLLYIVGVAAACSLFSKTLKADPLSGLRQRRTANMTIFWCLCLVAALGLIALVFTGQLALPDSAAHLSAQTNSAFLNQTYNLMLPLALFWSVSRRFNKTSVAVLFLVGLLYLYVGFRFRILLLLLASASAYTLVNRKSVRLVYVLPVGIAAVLAFNVVGAYRQYGRGIDASSLNADVVSQTSIQVGGEVGPLIVTQSIASDDLPPLILAEPWIAGLTIWVPRAIWPDKPSADYLKVYIRNINERGAEDAGIAGLQQLEMLLQFGWIGVAPLSAAYFSVILLLMKAVMRFGPAGRIVGCSIIPGLFGYYMQSRGYFAQILTDSIFLLGPVFLIYRKRLSLGKLPGSVSPRWGVGADVRTEAGHSAFRVPNSAGAADV